MVGAANVVTGDHADECGCSVRAGGLQTSEGICGNGGSRAVTITASLYTSVDTSGVATPELDVGICYRLASRCVDDVDVKMGDGALLASKKVLSDELTGDPWDKSVPLMKKRRSICLTVWSFGGFWIESACGCFTIGLLGFSRITADDFMFFRKAGSHTEFVKPVLPPEMLFPNPTAFNKVTLAFLDASAVRMVKMGLSPQDLPVDVSTWMCDNTGGQENRSQSLRDLNHDDEMREVENQGVHQDSARSSFPSYYTSGSSHQTSGSSPLTRVLIWISGRCPCSRITHAI